MNINDYEAGIAPTSWRDIVLAIFAQQAELMAKYQKIEGLPSAPVSLHHASGQRVIKDFAWRTVEELTESYEAYDKHALDQLTADAHGREELADALHFFVELCLFAGLTAEQCLECEPALTAFHAGAYDLEDVYWRATYKLGVAMNFLRNKAWKQSQVPTDEARFRKALLEAYRALMACWPALGCGEADVYAYYFRKAQVNAFRQRSNY